MEIQSESRIAHPLKKVYLAYRDRLSEIARYIPNVDRIEVAKREDLEDGVQLHNIWHAAARIPPVVDRFIKPEMLKWDDHARWFDREHHCDWKIVTRFFTDQVDCHGRTALFKDGAKATRVAITGELKVSLSGIPGVPRLLAGAIAPLVEKFVVALITPNLIKVNEALEKFLDDEG